MRVFVTGATGFIGQALVQRLVKDGHAVTAWVRSPERAKDQLPAGVTLIRAGEASAAQPGDDALTAAVASADGVVNLAGEPIVGKRWSTAQRAALVDSRVGLTERLVRAIHAAPQRPRVLVSGSAVGVYGDRADEELPEAAAAGQGFLAELCTRWEQAALAAEADGVRVVLVRTGIVLGKGGGALAKMLPAFKAGAGGPIAGGKQYQAWIHLDDLVSLIVRALADDSWSGRFNGSAPEPVTQRTFAKTLAKALGVRAFMPLPGFAVKLMFGQAGGVMMESQRALPKAALARGFRFQYPSLDGALGQIVAQR